MRFFVSGPRVWGVRPGIILGADDFRSRRRRDLPPSGQRSGSFTYVISDGHRVKVGVSANPQARIAALQTGNPRRLSFSFVAVTPGNGFDIEIRAKQMLARYREPGGGEEWFDTSPELAAAALLGCAAKIGQKLQPITPGQIGQILTVAGHEERGPGMIRSNIGFFAGVYGVMGFMGLLMIAAGAPALAIIIGVGLAMLVFTLIARVLGNV